MLLDVGMATEMGGDDQENMIGLFRSFAKMDGRTCGDWVLKFSGVEGCRGSRSWGGQLLFQPGHDPPPDGNMMYALMTLSG